MKKLYYMVLALIFWTCSPDAIVDCFSRSGNTEIVSFEMEAFDRVTIRRDIELRITFSETQSLSVEASDHIIDGIELRLFEGYLEIKAQDLCPSGSRNPPYIVHLETPNLTEIRNSSQFKVKSTNTLTFDTLKLTSENYFDELALASGDFELDVDLNQLNITHAGISDFILSGHVNNFRIGFYSGSGRIFAQNLIANNIGIYHRGFADVHVFPVEQVSGELRSTGNLILYNQPTTQDLETFFTGEIIYNTE